MTLINVRPQSNAVVSAQDSMLHPELGPKLERINAVFDGCQLTRLRQRSKKRSKSNIVSHWKQGTCSVKVIHVCRVSRRTAFLNAMRAD